MEIKEEDSKEYKTFAKETINELKNKLSNSLKLVVLIGSASSNHVIKDWSDIDFIIVVDKITVSTVEIIKAIVNNNNIKIGCTIYSVDEVSNKLIDSKSHYYFFLLQNGIINCYYKSEDFEMPNITKNDMQKAIYYILLNNMHLCKRNLLYETWDSSICKSQFKTIYASMKCLLILNEIYALNYKETFYNFCEMFEFEKLDYLNLIKSIKNNSVDILSLKEYSFKFINVITDNLKKRGGKDENYNFD